MNTVIIIDVNTDANGIIIIVNLTKIAVSFWHVRKYCEWIKSIVWQCFTEFNVWYY